jgi:hypothetical protein
MSGVYRADAVVADQHSTRASGAVLVAVQDSDPGFSPENFDRLFEPFYKTKADGMGMGALDLGRSSIRTGANGHCSLMVWAQSFRSVGRYTANVRHKQIDTSRYYIC